MILVSHEMNFARKVADRIIVMDQGTIIEEGPPAVVFNQPRHERTRKFLTDILREG